MSSTLPSWVINFFDTIYSSCDLEWNDEIIKYNAENIFKLLELKKGDVVFDQCCGVGSLSKGLTQLGCVVYGVDQSEKYIDLIKERKINGYYYADDAGLFSPDEYLDGAINWHTSIGYGGKDGSQKIINKLLEKLIQNKKFIIDIRNVEKYKKDDFKSLKDFKLNGEAVLMEKNGFWDGNVLVQNWKAIKNNNVIWQQENASCFHPSVDEINQLIKNAGGEIVKLMGNFEEEFDVEKHERLLIIGRKTK